MRLFDFDEKIKSDFIIQAVVNLKQIPKVTSILVIDSYQRARHNW